MEGNYETMINGMLEKLARGYNIAKAEWKADRRNPFKDGRFLAYYEAKEAILNCLNADGPISNAMEEISRRFNLAKADWKADRRNPFKDGKLLGYFEVLKQFSAACCAG